MAPKFVTWLDERLGLQGIYSTVFDRKVPKVNWWFTLGSASLFLLVMQVATGTFLSVYYVPSPDHAYDSVQNALRARTRLANPPGRGCDARRRLRGPTP